MRNFLILQMMGHNFISKNAVCLIQRTSSQIKASFSLPTSTLPSSSSPPFLQPPFLPPKVSLPQTTCKSPKATHVKWGQPGGGKNGGELGNGERLRKQPHQTVGHRACLTQSVCFPPACFNSGEREESAELLIFIFQFQSANSSSINSV